MSLPNWSSNPHLRRVLLRMQPDYTAIFGGRDRELEALDLWLAGAHPYALLLAPTGRGKTALVWHWLLRQQHEWHVIFVPVSIRYGNSNQSDVLAALTQAFAHMHDELEEFQQLQQTPNELRPKLAASLRRDVPDDTRVLLVLDGLDEATGWELGTDLLPATPPDNLRILLSAREMAQHSRAVWYAKLGLQAALTRDLSLHGLDRVALKELLLALGTPLDELAGDFDVLGELLRVSAGDPVLVRLLVQLLREERIQVGQLAALPHDDLNAVFALWLDQLDAQQNQRAQVLLHLLACAYGPLDSNDLLALAPDSFATADALTEAIAPLARFVIGDGASGYVFSHQKLRELYRDRWDDATFAQWNGRFVRYGKQAHSAPTPYLCRFLVAHLRDAGEWQFMRQLLTELTPQQQWAEARYALEGSYSGYLRDLEMLYPWIEQQHDLALSVHCSLISSSIHSISSNIDALLLEQLIKIGTSKGKWSVEAALEHIEQHCNYPIDDLTVLIEEGIAVPWERALNIVEQSNGEDLIYGYIALYPILPNHFKSTILDKLYQELQSNSIYLVSLLKFIDTLDPQEQARFMHLCFQKLRGYQNLPELFAATPKAWQAHMREQLQRILQDQLKEHIVSQQNTKSSYFSNLVAGFPFLPPDQQQILYWFDSLDYVLYEDITITMLDLLPEYELQAIRQLFLNYKPQTREKKPLSIHNILLLYHYKFPQTSQLLELAIGLLIANPNRIVRELLDLIPHQYHEQLIEYALMPDAKYPTAILIHFLPYAEALQPQLIEAILQAIPHSFPYEQSGQYFALLPYIPPQQHIELVEQALLTALKINTNERQIILQAAMAITQQGDTVIEQFPALFSSISQLERGGSFLFEHVLKKHPQFSIQVYQHLMSLDILPEYPENLLQYFGPQQQMLLAQRVFIQALSKCSPVAPIIFQHLSTEQLQQAVNWIEQNPSANNTLSLFEGLLNNSNYPSHILVPILKHIPDPNDRIYLIGQILPSLLEHEQHDLHPLIFDTLHELQQNGLRYRKLSPELLAIITEHLLQNIAQNFTILCSFHYMLPEQGKQQIGKLLYEHINNKSAWPLKTIIDNLQIFLICLPHFTHVEIQNIFNYVVSHNIIYTFTSLIPYINQAQLAQLHQLTQPLGIIARIDFYEFAHEHHQILEQIEYYQSLLEALHTYQQQHASQWDVISVVNRVAAYLQDSDARKLYATSLTMLSEQYVEFESYHAFSQAIPQLKRIGLINEQTLQQMIAYASHQYRNYNFEMLELILPPYLDTLAPEQQQQLASQIMQSVDQVVACWP